MHALNEAWRVLAEQGMMVDVRPICVDVALEVVCEGTVESAGMVDMSPDIDRDIASDKALGVVLASGGYCKEKEEQFDFNFYWKSIKGFKDDLDENWQDEINIPKEVWKRMKRLFNQGKPHCQIRLPNKMKMGIYRKLQ